MMQLILVTVSVTEQHSDDDKNIFIIELLELDITQNIFEFDQ